MSNLASFADTFPIYGKDPSAVPPRMFRIHSVIDLVSSTESDSSATDVDSEKTETDVDNEETETDVDSDAGDNDDCAVRGPETHSGTVHRLIYRL